MKRRGAVFRILILLMWLAGILLPMYSFRQLSPEYRKVFDQVFRTQAAHVLMHMFLYGVLACLVASFLPAGIRRSPVRTVALVMIVVLVVGVAQEAIQMRAESVRLGADEFFDVAVDLAGGLVGVLLFLAVARWRRRKPPG